MNRIERLDGRLEQSSEMNYSTIDFLFREERLKKWKKLGEGFLVTAISAGLCWLFLWGGLRNQ